MRPTRSGVTLSSYLTLSSLVTQPQALGEHTTCSDCQAGQGMFCGDCLWQRYGENLDEARCFVKTRWIRPLCTPSVRCPRSPRRALLAPWTPRRAFRRRTRQAPADGSVRPPPAAPRVSMIRPCQANANPEWRCPVCRNICNCSAEGCLRWRRGWGATGRLWPKCLDEGYPSAAHYLILESRRVPTEPQSSEVKSSCCLFDAGLAFFAVLQSALTVWLWRQC